MKNLSSYSSRRASTLIELMVSMAVIGITGTIIYYILYAGLTLFAKNTAINVAHQEARSAVIEMEQDIHGAVSIPQLTDASGNVVSGNGPAAGISFQLFAAGPFEITPTSNALVPAVQNCTGYSSGQPNITVRTNGFTPQTYNRLIIPTHQIESDLAKSGTGGTDQTIQLATNLPVNVCTTLANQQVNVTCFFTRRVYYYVIGTQLWYKDDNIAKVIANDLTSATPFSIPQTPLGAPYNRFVAAINLTTADTSSSNRHFRAANMFLNAMEPYRARLCIYQ